MKNKVIKKSKRLYFLLLCLAISIFVLVTPRMPEYAFGYLVIYPIVLVDNFIVDYHFKTVRQELEKIPTIEIVRIEARHDDDIVNALVKVKHKGLLQFLMLTKESFYNSPHLLVKRFGYLKTTSTCYPDGTGGDNIRLDVGIQGNESVLFPYKMHNVQDVINHYDDIVAVIQTWPKNYNDPHASHFQNKTKEKIEQCYYGIENANQSTHSN